MQFAVIYLPLFFEHLLFDGAQKIVRRLIQQGGFSLFSFCGNNFHVHTIK